MTHKQCKKCNAIKPLADFKRKLTRAQSLARGYVGAVRLEIESSMCKECQPKPRPPSRLSRKEIHNKIESGDVNRAVGEAVLERRKIAGKIKQGMASHNQWLNKWRAELRELLAPMRAEITSANAQARYANKKGQTERQEFFTTYADTLRQQLARTELDHLRNPRRVTSSAWEELIPKELASDIREAWGELPLEDRALVKTPALVLYRGN
jgi:hypothetical protein